MSATGDLSGSAPGGALPEHRDPFAGSLRNHLGPVTPNSEACRIRVDGEPATRRVNRWIGSHVMRATRTRNEEGEESAP